MRKLEHFDYEKVAKELHVPEDILKKIEKEVKEDYPSDSEKVLYELHVLRAVRSGYWKKWITALHHELTDYVKISKCLYRKQNIDEIFERAQRYRKK